MIGSDQLEAIARVTRPTTSTQFVIFNLFGDYILPAGGAIWTNDLLYLLDLLGIGERAARTTLGRMRQRGWFETMRHGRQSEYRLTDRGRVILLEGERRIFEAPLHDWDGRWHLVVYSLPERRRRLRNEFRKKLTWFGFGSLAPGTWISPHDRRPELAGVQADLEIESFVTMFAAETAADQVIVERCWDIGRLADDYRRFTRRFTPLLEAARADPYAESPETCFVRRFHLTYNFQTFPLSDPNLPAELLPADWIGYEARHLFHELRDLLKAGMGSFIENAIQG